MYKKMTGRIAGDAFLAGVSERKKLGVLVAGAVAAMFVESAPVHAQSVNPEAQQETQAVVVTGTRIRGQGPVGSPVIGVGRDDIENSSAISTTQLIQEVPQVFNIGVSDSSRGQSGGQLNVTYGSSINIRGLGPYSTLTLIDSHRAVPQGTSGYAVDASIIPTIAVQRIDIIADGASALYGSDAVAGVANIILRRRFDGVEASTRYGMGDDYHEYQVGTLVGKQWDSGGVVTAVERSYRSALSGLDREFYRGNLSDSGGGDYRVTQCNPGNIVVGGVSYAIPAGGVTSANRGSLVPGTVNRCDNLKQSDLLPQQQRDSAVVTWNQDVTDRIRLLGDAFYTRRTFLRNGGAFSSNLTVPRANPFYVAPPGLNPATESVQYSGAGDLPQPINDGFSIAYEATVGVEADLFGDWTLSANATRGRTKERSYSPSTVSSADLTAALARTDPLTAFNPFGARNTQAALDSIMVGRSDNRGLVDFLGFSAQTTGSLFKLPGGPVKVALGYEGQRLDVVDSRGGGTISQPSTTDIPYSRKVDSLFGELSIPVVGAGNRLPGLYAVDMNLAARYDRYDDVGSTTNPKVGLDVFPVRDLRLRGSYGTSFRAPTLNQRGNPASTGTLRIQNYGDPTCGCVIQGVTLSGGNPGIEPETARTYTLGADWAPSFARGLRLSVNYFDIKYEGQIVSFLSDLTILARESSFAGTGIITRNPSPQLMASLVAQTGSTTVLPNPTLLLVDARQRNLGVTRAQGFDLQAQYNGPQTDMGRFSTNLIGSYFTKYKFAVSAAAPLLDVLNTIYNPLRFKARGTLRWSQDKLTASVSGNYVNSYANTFPSPEQRVASYTTFDVRLGYDVGKALSIGRSTVLSLDARNLFDRKPPFVDIAQSTNGGGGFDPTVHDPIGRVIALTLDTKF